MNAPDKAAVLAHLNAQVAQLAPRDFTPDFKSLDQPISTPRPTDPRRVAQWLSTLGSVMLLIEAQSLARELALLKGHGHTPQEGAAHMRSTFGDCEAVVEYEYEPASGDGREEPHIPEEVNILGVLLNGQWCDIEGLADERTVVRWQQQALDEVAEQRDNDMADRAEAERDFA